MNAKKKIFIAIAVIIIAALLYGYKEYNRKNKDLVNATADIQMNAVELTAAFEKNEKEANGKFLDKIIAVNGKVKEINKDEKGYYTVVLGEDNNMSSVRCSMDPAHQQKAASLEKNNVVAVKGMCTGFNADELLGSDVIFNRCVIQNKN